MTHRIVGAQFADYVAEHGGGSVKFATGKPAEGPGFMVARAGSEKVLPTPTPSGEEIQDYADTQAPSVAGQREAHLGAWVTKNDKTVLDVSDQESIGSGARRAGRQHLQEAAYALGSESGSRPTRISQTEGIEDTDSLNRPYGTDVLLNMERTPKAEREAPPVVGVGGPRKRTVTTVPKRPDGDTPMYRDMADARVQANPMWARSTNRNDFNLNEVENDSWSMTNRQNPRKREGVEQGVNKQHGADSPRRTDLGDVLRTINENRTREARGEGLVVNPTKGWHPKTAGPSRVRSSQFDQVPAEYNEGLESERMAPRGDENADYFHSQVLAAVELHERLQREKRERES